MFIDHAVKSLTEYKTMEPDWDGHGSFVPPPVCMDSAIEFLKGLEAAASPDIKCPGTSLSEINVELYWKRPGVWVGVFFEIDTDDKLDIYAMWIENGRLIWDCEAGEDVQVMIKAFSELAWLDNL